MKPRFIHLLNFSLAFLIVLSARSATIPVTSTADNGAGTVRAALAAAVDGDTIDATGVSGTILLTSGELFVGKSVSIVGAGPANLAVDGNAASSVFHIGSSTIVNLSGLTITNGFAGGQGMGGGIFNDHAALTVSNCWIIGNKSSRLGGGIHNNGFGSVGSATLNLVNTIVSSNSAGGPLLGPGIGGGVFNEGDGYGHAILTIVNSVFIGNSANNGGGVNSDGETFGRATVVAINSTFSGNTAASYGGGIYSSGFNNGQSSLTVQNSTITNNLGAIGGGIANAGTSSGHATLEIRETNLSGNSAPLAGGGIANFSGDSGIAAVSISATRMSGNTANDSGGAIYNSSDFNATVSVTITNSTLNDNSAFGGGGIANGSARSSDAILTIVNSTLSDNSASATGGGIENDDSGGTASVQILNSTLSGNLSGQSGGTIFLNNGNVLLEIGSTILNAGGSSGTIGYNDSGVITSLGYNLSSDNADGLLTNATDQINTDPMLGPLQDNGGPTFTHALLCNSPAIGKGKNLSGSATDQRGAGFIRTYDDPFVVNAPGGDGTDIGAFEVQHGICDSPAKHIGDLIALVQGLNLPSGAANSLTVKLQAAHDALVSGNSRATCGSLGAFVNEVNAQKGKKLTVAQANLLLTGVRTIQTALNCQ